MCGRGDRRSSRCGQFCLSVIAVRSLNSTLDISLLFDTFLFHSLPPFLPSLSLFIPLSFVQFNITEMGNFITTCCVPCPWVKEICLHKSFKLSKWRSNTIFSKKLNSFYCKNIHTTKSCFNCNYVGLSNYQLQQFYYTVLVQLTYNRNCRHEIT